MTARVFNPSLTRAMPRSQMNRLNRIRRDLFGPVNPAETTKIFTDELEKQQEKATMKWGFDFRTGSPLVAGNTQFIWERASFPDFVPEMYTLSRGAHVRELPEVTAFDLLMDERADRENISSSNAEDSCDDSQDESMVLFKAPAASAAPSAMASSRTLRKRQPKITEYMKERKRLAQTLKKNSPSKRARTTSGSSLSSLLNSLRNLQRNH